MTAKEITYRNWFITKFGIVNLDTEERVNYIKPKSHADLEREYRTDMGLVGYSSPTFNSVMKYSDTIEREIKDNGAIEVPPMKEAVTFTHIKQHESVLDENGENPNIKKHVPYELNTFILDDMVDVEPRLMKTGTIFDAIHSDFEEGGGLYGGTVTIVTGESGSGKTTLLTEYMAMLQEYAKENKDEDLNCMFVSSEMTKNDLQFYRRKTPAIGKVPTVLVMDYIRSGHLIEMLEDVFTRGYEFVLLDSFADTVGKVMDVAGYTEKQAMRWLIDLMLRASEDFGTAVFAIQHLTKGGTYVGSTYLKHTTTAMLELWIDKSGKRYAYYSKNRRGGSMQKKPIFFELKEGRIVFDEKKFNEILEAEQLAKKDAERRDQSAKDFLDILEHREKAGEGKESDGAQELDVDGLGNVNGERKPDEPNLEELNQQVKTELENEAHEEKPNGPLNFGDAIDSIAEDVAFEETNN